MKIVFFGTPDFAIPTLKRLIDSHHEVIAVVTQPDRPSGRNGKLVFCPVKQLALKYNIPVLQYEKIRRDGVADLIGLNADVFVTAAYGQILSKEILEASKYGVFNVHGSLLPKYRGAAPIQWAVINGDKTTGITILKSDVGMDDGDIILKKQVDILNGETAGELFDRLSVIGADCLMDALDRLEDGTITYTPQDHSLATICKMLKKENNRIDFNNPAFNVQQFILGYNPSPVAEMMLEEGRFRVYRAKEYTNPNINIDEYKIGEVVIASAKIGLVIKCDNSLINILQLQADNGKVLDTKSFLNGKHIRVGQIVNE